MGKITDLIRQIANEDGNTEEACAAEAKFLNDIEDPGGVTRLEEGYFKGAIPLDPNSAKYDTYRTIAKKYGTSYFLKLPVSLEYDDTWDLLKEEYQINHKLIEEHCPHIVKYYELGTCSDGRPFVRAEYIHGETLADYLSFDANNRRKNEEVIVDYFRNKANIRRFIRQFLECLQRMHELSVVHHDLKPGNLLIDCIAGNLYVLDFDMSVGPSSTNKIYGWTDGYEDPEAAELWKSRNADWYDVFGPLFDIYSFGVIIKEIFKSYKLQMPAAYKHILNKCTCKRKNRYQHVEDILHDFMDYWSLEGHDTSDFIKMTKVYQAASAGNERAKQLVQEFLALEKELK